MCVGIIPARAGFTVGPLGGNAGQGDHPRSRGVYTARSSSTPSPSGSSPLARGLRGDRRPRCPRTRIIPARAGFTDQGAQAGPVAGDHPRSRGVYRPIERPGIGALGSSPLARGLRRDRPPRRLRPGIIPARAGFTPRPGRQAAGAPDHPRSRGVYAPGRGVRGGQDGSSPLARGLPPVTRMVTKPCRIIPARAGFTVRALTRLFRGVDHPRSRGVYTPGVMAETVSSGSSPLARGLHGAAGGLLVRVRIIPARAGFTFRSLFLCACSWDHPRSRGVYR